MQRPFPVVDRDGSEGAATRPNDLPKSLEEFASYITHYKL
jgi:hypothetical protein